MGKKCIVTMVASAAMLAGAARAQEPAPQPTAAAGAPAAETTAAPSSQPGWPFTQGGMDFTYMFDGYVNGSFNDPPSGFNQLHNFDLRANTAHVNMAMISIDRAPAPVGFHVDVGFGEVFNTIKAAERAPDEFRFFKQAYVSVKPKSWHGFGVDAGKFVTSAGAEVIEANANWNYSRSLLFALAIPYYHFGIRTSFPVGKNFTGGVQLVQGWNNTYDTNSGKTVGLTGAYAWKKLTWSHNYYVGPEKIGTNKGMRHVYDTTVLVNQTDKLSYYINFDYGQDKNVGPGASKWTGIAGATRYALSSKTAIAGRLEFFDDIDGFSTGTKQRLSEVTLTGEYKPVPWLIARLEFRNDWSNKPFFEKDSGLARTQPTVLLGLIAVLGPKR